MVVKQVVVVVLLILDFECDLDDVKVNQQAIHLVNVISSKVMDKTHTDTYR